MKTTELGVSDCECIERYYAAKCDCEDDPAAETDY